MFLHIGENVYILKDEIVAILNKDTFDNSKESSIFIEKLIENGYLKNKKLNGVKTYIITSKNRRTRKSKRIKKEYNIYLSNISSTTLLKRSRNTETEMEV